MRIKSIVSFGTAILMGSMGFIARADSPPNFIVVFLDDAGWRDVSYAGNKFIETPNIDRLSRKGVVFSNAYATHAFCSPSRQSMMTGQWPARTAWMRKSEVSNPGAPIVSAPHSAAGAHAWSRLIPEFTSIAAALKSAGYSTAHIGKSHLHLNRTMSELGFDYTFGDSPQVGAVKDFFAPYDGLPGDVEAPEGEYLTDRLTQETIEFIKTNRSKPFYAQLWHYAPHVPIQAPEEIVEKYRRKRQAMGDISLNPTYAAMMDVVDQGVGLIYQTLEQLGLEDNTVILFSSDNGALTEYGALPITSVLPYRGAKGFTYMGGLRVPMFVYWPGHTGGLISDKPVTIMDFYSTVLEIAGVPYPNQPQDGCSLVPLLSDGDETAFDRRSLFWYNVTSGSNADGSTFQPVAAVQKDSWRLVRNFELPLELYHLETDLEESVNLVSSNPEKTHELNRMLDEWMVNTGVATPTPNPRYDPEYVVPRHIDPKELPEGRTVVREWTLNSADCGWKSGRSVKVSIDNGAMRMRAMGVYPEIMTENPVDLPAGVYAVEVDVKVATSGRIRFGWEAEGRGPKYVVEFYPPPDGSWHTLTGIFQSKSKIKSFSFAAPTHLETNGLYDPKIQPRYIEVRAIRISKFTP